MVTKLLISTCVLLALNITPNGSQKLILRVGLGNGNEKENLSNVDDIEGKRHLQKDNRYDEKDDTKLQSFYIDQKPILTEGFTNQLINSRNLYNNLYKEKDDYQYIQRDDNYKETNANRFENRDFNKIEDGQSVEAVQNERIYKALAKLLSKGRSNEYFSPEKPQSPFSSFKSKQNSRTRIHLSADLKCYSRSGVWESCGKKASKVCNKACKEAIKRGCTGSSCKKKIRNRMKKDCKSACRDRFEGGKDSDGRAFNC